MRITKKTLKKNEYKYGFHDDVKQIVKIPRGLNQTTIDTISKLKHEPAWMHRFRAQAFIVFLNAVDPWWGPQLQKYIHFDDYVYYTSSSQNLEKAWKDVPEKIRKTFQRIGIPEAEQKFLAGVTTQYDSEAVYHSLATELDQLGVIFTTTDEGLRKHPEIFQKYFGTVVPPHDNKYAALNSAVWSGGSFIYIPKNIKLVKPLQSYFRINAERMGQFERTLIIADEGAEVHYIEGCTAPIYQKDSLHAAVVEIIVHERAKVRYTTIQNWSENVLNLVTKRAKVMKDGTMEWIDGNIGSHINMKYPSCFLVGERARGYALSIAVANGPQIIQDTGAKMIHLAPNTRSQIIAKGVVYNGGESTYRGMVRIDRQAHDSHAQVSCDTLILDKNSRSQTIPWNLNFNASSVIEHEAQITEINAQQLLYLENRGISRDEATKLITLGFLEPFAKELPMEYAVELNQLIKLDMSGAVS